MYGMVLVAGLVDLFQFNLRNIAFQSDSSGFVAVIGYAVVLYGFMADYWIFEIELTTWSLIGALLIAVVTVGVTLIKLK